MTAREGQTFAGESRWITYANFVKLPHTVFLLPFALVGATFATYTAPVTTWKVVGIVVAFTAARFAAMGFNRIVDREIDARNPRTARRELPRGAMTLTEAKVAVSLASVVFVLSTTVLSQSPHSEPLRGERYKRESQIAATALKSGDMTAFRAAVANLHEQFPNNSRWLRNLAAAEARLGNRDDAV